jgi:hypothetical protein
MGVPYRLLEFGAEMGVKAGYHEEPDDESDVDDVIHRLLLLVVSNLDFEFLYIVASRSWVISRVAFASQADGGDLARPLTDRRLDTPSGIPLEAQL